LEPETTLGAAAGNTVVLSDEYVSAQHARLRWDGVNWWVEDLGSSNGTQIDGRPCPSHSRQPLPFGSTLRVGRMTFELIE
jgi:pSer/pThr/pTyr-binding forkhead associated (FHA) protein